MSRENSSTRSAYASWNLSPAQEMQRALRFGCVGLIGVGVNTAVLWLLTEQVHLFYLLSSALATQAAILSNFTLNQVWTFASLSEADPILTKLAKYNLVALGGLLLTVASLFALTRFFGLHYLVANILAIASGTAWNYASSRYWVWTKRRRIRPTRRFRTADDRIVL